MFSIFLNDLNAYLTTKQENGVNRGIDYDDISIFMKILVVLFADDTVIFGTTEADLQYSLDIFQQYCEHKKLSINVSKTKIRGLLFKSVDFPHCSFNTAFIQY